MKHIVVDLEMHPIPKMYKEERLISRTETIEIGAVVLDSEYKEIGSFKTLVKPQYSIEIEPYYARLTGITTEMVQNAPFFEEALTMLFAWCHSIKDDLRFYQWSENDLTQLQNEINLKHIPIKPENTGFLQGWEDFQMEYTQTLGVEQQVGLKKAVHYAGVEFEGKQHDALFDAKNTATLLGIIRTPERCEQALEHVIEALTPSNIGVSLGEMFDFDSLLSA